MPSQAEIIRALDASLRLARGDASGFSLFDNSMQGFWRSFSAIVLIAPLFLLAIRAELSIAAELGGPAVEGGPDFYLARLVLLGIEWIAYPIAMVPLARLLGLGARYAPYIIAYNWTTVPIVAVLVAPGLLHLAGILPAALALFLNLAATGWALWFRFSVARGALGTPFATSVGLVIFDFLLSITINVVGDAIGR